MTDNKEEEKKTPSKELVPKGDDFFNAVSSAEKADPKSGQQKA